MTTRCAAAISIRSAERPGPPRFPQTAPRSTTIPSTTRPTSEPAKPNACMVTVAAAAADAAKELADQEGRIGRANALDDFAQYVEATHDANCLGPQQESFSYQALPGEYHFTLKYYDQARHLVHTVPPAGVHPLSDTAANNLASDAAGANPAHTPVSTHAYNSLGQVIANTTPDAGMTRSR